jgi:hypothetical protein
MKKSILLTFVLFFCLKHCIAQNSLNSGDFNGGSWGSGQSMSSSAGSSLIITKSVSSAGDKYFRFYGDGSPCGEYQPNSNGDFFTSGVAVISPNSNCGGSNAWRINVPTASSSVVFKTDGGNDGIDKSVAFVVQGAVRTFSSHTAPVNPFRNTSTRVTVTMSGTFATGQNAYIRFHTGGGFGGATIGALTYSGSGSDYYYDIPGQVAGTTVTYYFFTSGSGLTISNADADLFTINLLNNGGDNYTTTFQNYFFNGTGNWSTGARWNAGSAPPSGEQVTISNSASATLDVDATVSSLTILSSGVFNCGSNTITIANGGNIANGNTFTAGSGTVVFAGAGSTSTNPITFNNLTINGAVTFSHTPTINGTLRIDAGYVGSTPSYGSSSTLNYNTGSSYNVSLEWAGGNVTNPTADFGVPANIIISTPTVVNIQGNSGRGVPGNVTVNGTLVLGNLSSGDLRLGGNLEVNGILTHNSRAVFFEKQTGIQTISSSSPLTIPFVVYGTGSTRTVQLNGADLNVTDLNFSSTASFFDLNGRTLSISGSIANASTARLIGSSTSNLTLSHTSGTNTLFFDRSTDASTNVLQDLTINGAGGTTQLGDVSGAGTAQLYINRTLSVSAGTLNLSNAVTGNHLVLVSDGTNLARIADLGTTGSRLTQGANTKIVVERSTLNKRAWRLISAPLTGNGLGYSTSQQSVQYQWQNHQTSPLNTLGGTGFGTNIYGPSGTGMDAVRPGYSMLRWNYGLQNWRNVTNTTTEPMFGNGASGYTSTTDSTVLPTFLFARGDKTITTTTGSNAGRLRAVGKLLTGQQVFNYPGVGTGTKYVAIANPYAAPVDFESLMAGLSSNLKNPSGNTIYYYWDPSLNNFGGAFGGWVTVTRDNAGGYSQISGTNGRYIQSGTAILIQPSDQLASSATFQESYKATTVVAGTHGAGNSTIDKLVVQLRNADNAIGILDGSIAMFGSGYRREFDKTEDGIKLEQNNETISFINGSLKTGVESRGYIQQADTLYMNLERTTTGTNYAFEFDPSNFDATVTSAKLVDKFLNSETPISLSAKTTVPFSVTATAGSNAADRFMIVFEGTGALPNRSFSVTGEKLGTNKVKINWEAVNEFGVKHYELEHSTDGRTFSKINTQVGKNGNATNSYTFTDNNPSNGVNYYRIKTTQNNDIERYSSIITINFKTSSSNNVNVYPNPVKGNVIGLQLQDLEKGVYSVRLLSIEGKEVYKQQLQVNGSNLSTTINPSTRLAQGTYTLQLVGKNGSYTQKVVVE